jgi:PAS domain S-box-containing protein
MSIASRPTSDGPAVRGAWSSQATLDPSPNSAAPPNPAASSATGTQPAPNSPDERPERSGLGIPGFTGSSRVRLPLFALVALGTVLLGVIPFPHDARIEILIALAVFFILLTAAFTLSWERLPNWMWLTIPIGYMGVIALIRDAQGGGEAALVIVYILPIVWISLYGRRLHLLVGLLCMDLALMLPVLLVGAPNYSIPEWRQVIILIGVTTLVAGTIASMVHRDRLYVSDLARQSLLARRNAEDADNARDRLETLLRAATGSAIMGVDPAGTVTFFSAGAELMLGYQAAEVVGIRSITDFIDPAQIDERRRTIDAMRNALDPARPEAVAEVPWTARRKDGEYRRCVVRVRTLPTPGGAEPASGGGPPNAGYVVVAIDVTEREELAAERERLYAVQKEVTQSLIEQNNRLRELTQMKDDVVATVSHELRTPITSIRGFIELLLDGVPNLTEDQVRMLHTIERNSAQLQRVAEDLLADPGGGHGLRVAFTELDLHKLAGDAVHACQTSATTARVSVTLKPGPGVTVFGDPTRLHQLLGNLLSNAIKFAPAGGRVHVVVDAVDDFARTLVLDDGPGIPEAERPQLFERFYRLASSMEMGVPGTGLGLAIAKSVAEAHEGFIDIVDTPGWSTTFRVFLPMRRAAPATPEDDVDGEGDPPEAQPPADSAA